MVRHHRTASGKHEIPGNKMAEDVGGASKVAVAVEWQVLVNVLPTNKIISPAHEKM